MGGAIHELRACGISLLEPLEFIDKLTIDERTDRVPPGIWHESTMEQVEASQIFDVEIAGEMVSQFGRSKQVKEAMGRAAEVVAPSSSIRTDGGCPVVQINDLSRSLAAFDPI